MARRVRFHLARYLHVAVLAAALLLALVPAVSSSAAPGNDAGGLSIEVLCSPPQYVSGGGARLRVTVPDRVDPGRIEVTVDGADVTDGFAATDDGALEGVVDGLPEGDAEVVARIAPGSARGQTNGGRRARLVVTNHPISGPMFSGPQQQPFGCSTDGDLDETGVDGGPRLTMADPADGCAMETLVSYIYRPAGADSGFVRYDPADPPAEHEVATTTTIDGDDIPFIVRWERGTINRFVDSIAIPSPAPNADGEPVDLSTWNDRLILRLQGGVGIGHYQGEPDDRRMLDEDGLSRGYAIAYSTGAKTGEHHNLQVGGETAIMVKDRFVTTYGAPRYTLGVGASGGAIQQYVYGQNHPGLLDAGIPVQSHPDMVTQTIHVGDCELLARGMDQRVITGADDAAQYGLQALRDGHISPQQFLDLNWEVGSWKNEPDMVQEACPYIGALCSTGDIDIWSQRNMDLATDDAPAPRAEADPGAIEAAYTSGLVFRGDIDIPIIDWRPYLEPVLDMHNSHQSFAARQRMLDHDGDASNQVIWFTGAEGPCTEQFPVYGTSRTVAGAQITGDVFKCELQPLQAAVARGVYGDWQPDEAQLATLGAIFPDGVCDHRKGDARRPPSLR